MSSDSQHPTEWKETTLDDLAHYINGYAFKPDDWKSVGLPIIRIQQINDPEAGHDCFDGPIADQYRIDNGDLLFSWSATLTTLIWDRGPAILNQHIFKVVPKEGTDLHFLHHLLEYLMGDLAGQTHGSTMRHIKRSDLLPFPVVVPLSPEQRRIAEILDAADEAVRQTERLIVKLKAVKAGLLHDLLTRGLDEHGHLRDPQAHPEQFKDSPLGRIPREWEIWTMEELTTKIVDGVHKTPRYVESGIPFLTVENLTAGSGIDFRNVRYVRYRDHLEYSKRADPRPGDVLVSKDGTLGVARVVPGRCPEFSIFVSVAQLRPDTNRVLPAFIKTFFETDEYKRQLGKRSAGTGLRHIHLEHFRAFELATPSVEEQQRIAAFFDAHDACIRAEEAELAKLRQVKRGLMDDLLTGRVRVKPHRSRPVHDWSAVGWRITDSPRAREREPRCS